MMPLDPLPALVLMAALYGAGAVAALLSGKGARGLAAVYGLAAAGGAAGAVAAGAVLLQGTAMTLALPPTLPLGRPELRLDGLAAVFLLLISVGAITSSVYAPGYLRRHAALGSLRGMGACFHVFLLAMALVVLADDTLLFLIAWETMSLASLGLVLAGDPGEEGRRAGVAYIVTMHIGTGCLLGALLLSAQHAGAWSFEGFRAAGGSMPEPARSAVFLLALLGFGIKAGVVPLHGWLPLAHPAAPSHVSALMSGVMIKLGVYMLLRFTFEFLGSAQLAWGVLLLGLGLVSALLGVLFALAQHDLKRLLAFHSVENIGIILIAAGTAALLVAAGHPAIAALALAASLFHTVNHMAFKSLLFLASGSVVTSAGSRNIEHLGGLARRMPWTAGAFLVGAMAISALPPLNGFASEWLVFQGLLGLLAAVPGDPFLAAVVVGAAAVLALTSALAAACFVKAYGFCFSGSPRTERASTARESPSSMLAPMVALAGLCAALGIGAGLAIGPLLAAASGVLGTAPPGPQGFALPGFAGATTDPLLLALLLAAGVGAGLVLSRSREGTATRAPAWACGEVAPAPRFQATATAYAAAVLTVFERVLRPSVRVEMEGPAAPYAPSRVWVEAHHEDVFQLRLYDPVPRFLRVLSVRLRVIQSGSLQAYIAYMLAATLLALLVVRLS
ncbi:MAG TPA: proton-conducting transporter membrane subunit [Candidatus Thermoplasmatota archaeon]|jgi:hydrogenase-4 component B|nr:proton-conducting transporter membrane subunit [Candidatus Thermoplasmatota archaeon]